MRQGHFAIEIQNTRSSPVTIHISTECKQWNKDRIKFSMTGTI